MLQSLCTRVQSATFLLATHIISRSMQSQVEHKRWGMLGKSVYSCVWKKKKCWLKHRNIKFLACKYWYQHQSSKSCISQALGVTFNHIRELFLSHMWFFNAPISMHYWNASDLRAKFASRWEKLKDIIIFFYLNSDLNAKTKLNVEGFWFWFCFV